MNGCQSLRRTQTLKNAGRLKGCSVGLPRRRFRLRTFEWETVLAIPPAVPPEEIGGAKIKRVITLLVASRPVRGR